MALPSPASVGPRLLDSRSVSPAMSATATATATAANLRWRPLCYGKIRTCSSSPSAVFLANQSSANLLQIQAFRRRDFDGFARRVASGEALKDAWRSANDGFERFLYDARKAAERFDRQYTVSRRLDSFARSAAVRVRELDQELGVQRRWRAFTLNFSRNWPRYKRELSGFLESPLGKSSATIFFLWFALSGWMFRFIILATWVLPFAAPLLIGAVANNFVIEGACPACKRQFMGYRNQIIRCASCRSIVWQPGDSSSKEKDSRSSKSGPDIIDVEFEEK